MYYKNDNLLLKNYKETFILSETKSLQSSFILYLNKLFKRTIFVDITATSLNKVMKNQL